MTRVIPADAEFWNRSAAGYAKKRVADEQAYQKTLERVRRHLCPSDRVLEVGCGTGTTALKLSPFAAHILATDLSREMIRIARQKGEAEGVSNVEFRECALDDATLAPATFDMVMAFNVLHLVPDAEYALGRIHELLKPGGLFIQKTPCIGESWVRHILPLMRRFGMAPRVVCLKAPELIKQVELLGFSVSETDRIPAKSPNVFVVAHRLGANEKAGP